MTNKIIVEANELQKYVNSASRKNFLLGTLTQLTATPENSEKIGTHRAL